VTRLHGADVRAQRREHGVGALLGQEVPGARDDLGPRPGGRVALEAGEERRRDDRVGVAGEHERGHLQAAMRMAPGGERARLAQEERPVDRAARPRPLRRAQHLGVGVELVVVPAVVAMAAAADQLADEDRQAPEELLAGDRRGERELVGEGRRPDAATGAGC